mmetsp:Transcript_74867/g.206498  ORF Transcript_74867/g.206498 Transcript_74867/m.206498 type:complete len:163 (-) Transcript_74867:523-1011(-)
MTSISGLPASIDPLRKVERTYAEKRDRTKAPVPAPLINDESSSADETPDNNQSAEKCKTSGCTLMKHPTNVQHSFHKGCQYPMCSKSSHSDLELHSFQENLPNRRGGRGAPQQIQCNSMTKEWTELMSNNTFPEPIDRSSIPPGRKLCEHISLMGWDLKFYR